MRSRHVQLFIVAAIIAGGLYIHFALGGDVASREGQRHVFTEQKRSLASIVSVESGDGADLDAAVDPPDQAVMLGQTPAPQSEGVVPSDVHSKWQAVRSHLLAKAALCQSEPGAACETYHRALDSHYFTYSQALLADAAVDETEELLLLLEEACRAWHFASCTQTFRLAGLIGDDGRRQSMLALMTERCEGSSEEGKVEAYCSFLAMTLMEDGNLSEADRMASIGCSKKSLGGCFVRASVQYATDFELGFPKALKDLCDLYEKDGGELADPAQICRQLKSGDLLGRNLPDGYLRLTYEFSPGKSTSVSNVASLYYARRVK